MPLIKPSRTLISVILLMGSGILLSACASNSDFATLKGACEAFPRPKYQVKGKTRFDQVWADRITEAGVAGCHWERPKKRPASLDAQTVVVTPVTTPALTIAVPLPKSNPPTVTVVPKRKTPTERTKDEIKKMREQLRYLENKLHRT